MARNVHHIVSLLLVVTSGPAFANWQSTRWGMSKADLLRVNPSAQPNQNRSLDSFLQHDGASVEMISAYETDGAKYVAFYSFDAHDRLMFVDLAPQQPSDCVDLPDKLRNAYGDPLDNSRARSFYGLSWRDTAKGNAVRFLKMGGSCTITYSPLPSGGL